jgi:hypothetical protein
MHILWFDWRDIQNPEANGAGVFIHDVMKRLPNIGIVYRGQELIGSLLTIIVSH